MAVFLANLTDVSFTVRARWATRTRSFGQCLTGGETKRVRLNEAHPNIRTLAMKCEIPFGHAFDRRDISVK
ncbi:hypothetical protein ACVMB1_006107 [Bradyrhizobium sp. USDA 4504]